MGSMRYPDLYASGELFERVRTGYRMLQSCSLCPHQCGVNRIKGQLGRCKSGLQPKIASATVHRGEEPPISGMHGSGTVFLSGCTLSCQFCQNYPISQQQVGDVLTTIQLAKRMVSLQHRGVHNLNFVTPTHWTAQILAALWLAVPMGFRIPVVWNTSGFESPDVLALLDGVVDIYLPDMKYADVTQAMAISGVDRYRTINRQAVDLMYQQVGDLQVDDNGIAQRGLIIRHLVLPGQLAGSAQTLEWIGSRFGTDVHVSVMSQYFPAHRAVDHPVLGRSVSVDEYDAACDALEAAGLEQGWVQELDQAREPSV